MTVERTRSVTLDEPVNVSLTLALLRRGAGDPALVRDGSRLWRTTRMPTGPASMVIRQVSPTRVDASAWGPGAEAALDSVPRMIGARDDVSGFEPRHALVADAYRRRPGLRVPSTGRVLEALVPAVLEQKVVGLDAFAAWRRLLQRFGEPAPGPVPDGMRVVPTAAQWAAIPSWEWHLAGVDAQRARTAQACARVGASIERLGADDASSVYRGLRSIPGVGVWTAAEVGSRALGDADAVPFGDYHLGGVVGTLVGERSLTDAEVAEVLEPWRGHRGRVVRLLQLSPLAVRERRGPRMPRVDHRRI